MAFALALVGFIGGSVGSSLLGGVMEPVNYAISKMVWAAMKGKIPPEDVIIRAYYLGIIEEGRMKDYLHHLGYGEPEIKEWLSTYRRLLTIEQALQAWGRGLMKDDELKEYLRKQGFDDKDIERIKQIVMIIPSPSDLIEMAVREVFNEEAAKKLQLDDEFEGIWNQLEPWAKKVFMSKDVMRMYWRAHWRLPSPEQVITMYNMFYPLIMYTKLPNGRYYGEKYNKYVGDFRRIITDDKLVDDYLKWYDISPIWRDRFKAMTYPPLTRVDLRRIYALGLISDQECLARIMQLGYAYEDAKKLLEFYKTFKVKEVKQLTKAEIHKAYTMKLLTKDQAIKYLTQLGYTREEAEFYIRLWEYELRNKNLTHKITTLTREYINGYITIQELNDALNQLGLPGEAIQEILNEAQLLKRYHAKLPSKADVLRWFKLKLISGDRALTLLSLIGYPDNVAKLYLQEAEINKSGKVALPSKDDIKKMLRYQVIDLDTAKEYLRAHGYDEETINRYIKLWSLEGA